MARHSKWHKVRQFKGAIDAKRSASFTKLAREITIATKEKGSDPVMNARLRVAIERARKASLPKDNIERAIQKGVGGTGEAQLEELRYEAYAPGGTALIIECVTDNRNRSTNDVKHLISNAGGSLASPGSVTYLFDRFGVVRVVPRIAESLQDEIELSLIEAGACDILSDEEGADIRCSPNDLATIVETVQKLHLHAEIIEFEWIPRMTVETEEDIGMQVQELIDELDVLDDVSRVYSNMA
ncbi:YebC/PmpR family DNA-binding transcriptional regulator [Candidatus Uhrbacteria bacterium]|nr:YebC/PmpR family DNA-binding transcriptional regulator [Candidatus Uhrbacteria bacterium]